MRGNLGIEIGHCSVLSEERAFASCAERVANDLAFIVNAEGNAEDVAGKLTEIGDRPVLPEEGMRGCVTRQVGKTDHFTLVIDGLRSAERASEIAEVSRCPVLPQ